MELAGYVPEGALAGASHSARLAAELGVPTLLNGELAHDPFIPLAFAASAGAGCRLGTSVAMATGRTPWATAVAAWDVARIAGGPVVLGLGTQVRAHVTRRFGGSWNPPVPFLRDYIGAVRALWAAWQDGVPLHHRSAHFQLDLMAPMFDPGPLDPAVAPQIHIGGVSPAFMRLAAEVADGFIAHGFHTRAYLEEVVVPALARDDDVAPVELIVPPLVGIAEDDASRDAARERVRQQVAFYASTPSYRRVLEHHGWGEVQDELGELARQGRWADLAATLPDEVVDAVGVTGTAAEVGAELRRRYEGVADVVAPYLFVEDATRDVWAELLHAFRS